MGYDDTGKQLKKTTTFRPPDNVTASKAEKLAREFAVKWEDKIRFFVALMKQDAFRVGAMVL